MRAAIAVAAALLAAMALVHLEATAAPSSRSSPDVHAASTHRAPPPLPVRNPLRPALAASGSAATAASPAADAPRWSAADVAVALAQCKELLAASPAEIEPQPPIAAGPCGAPAPVLLKRIGREPSIELSPPALVSCPVVAALGRWMDTTLQPTARRHLGAPVTRMMVAASYHCRNRNNAAAGKLSEHALANAIDIRAFDAGDGALEVAEAWLNPAARPPAPPTAGGKSPAPGRVASIGPAPSSIATDAAGSKDAFMRAIHAGACGPFTTVLGPDADAAHLDHLHFDLARRRSGANFCR